jgi:hypothetical protein
MGGGDGRVRKAPLPWLLAGVLLGLTQVTAVALQKPLGVSTQFVVADSKALHAAAPDYAEDHDLIGKEKYTTFGYGWWLDVGLVCGALIAAIASRRWRLSVAPAWWQANGGRRPLLRFLACFFGGFLILLGARFAHGCTSGQFASGWAQLALSAVPFTAALFVFGMLTAFLVYRNAPSIER